MILMALIFSVVNTLKGGMSQGVAIGVLVLYASVIISGVQVVVYSLIMEFLVNKIIKSIHAVAILSGLLGFMVVTSAYFILGGFEMRAFERDPYTPVIGLIIGILMGYTLKGHYGKSANKTN